MDIPRPPVKNRRRLIYGGIALVAIVAITVALKQLPQAAPTVERSVQWIDTVRKGTMIRNIRAPGTLVPEQIRFITSVTGGRVENVPLRPGASVHPSTTILELSNPDVQLQALQAEQTLAAQEAQLVTLSTGAQQNLLNQQTAIASIRTQLNDARRQQTVLDALDKKGLSTANDIAAAKDRTEELTERLGIEQQRLKILQESNEKELTMQRAQVDRARAVAQFQRTRVESMHVAAGEEGQLLEMALELGQWVQSGTVLAKVAQPGRLKAVLRVAESQAKDVVIGQRVEIDTRNGIIKGRVIRSDPASQTGSVAVEVALEGALPAGARPDLSVDGTIEIERLDNVMYVGRPSYGQPESTVGLFRLEPDGKTAVRVNVKLGRSSVNTIEVLQGLNVNDKVIISDMSGSDNVDRVRLR